MAGRKTTNDGGIVGPQIFQVWSSVAWWCGHHGGTLFASPHWSLQQFFLGGFSGLCITNLIRHVDVTWYPFFRDLLEHSQSIGNPEGMWFLCVVAITSSCFAMREARQGFAYGTAGFPVYNRSEQKHGKFRPVNESWSFSKQNSSFFPLSYINSFWNRRYLREKSRHIIWYTHPQHRSSCWGS